MSSPKDLLRVTVTALLVLAVVPLAAYLAVGFLVPVAFLIAALVLAARRPRTAAGCAAAGAALLAGGYLWAGWVLGVVINGDEMSWTVETVLGQVTMLVALGCLAAAVRVWRRTDRAVAAG